MICDNGTYYLYRHVRKDARDVFYVGIAKKNIKGAAYEKIYNRAYSKKDRSRFWNFITDRNAFEVEVLLESEDRDFIQRKEIEFIKLYGRRDLKTGSLVNLTDGGDNGLNRSEFAIRKQIDTSKRNNTYQKNIERLRQYAPTKGRSPIQRKTYLYDSEGHLIKEFISREECGAYLGIKGTNITNMIRRKCTHRGFIASDCILSKQIIKSSTTFRRIKDRRIIQLCPINRTVIAEFDKMVSAAEAVAACKGQLWHAIKNKWKCKGYYWEYKTTQNGHK